MKESALLNCSESDTFLMNYSKKSQEDYEKIEKQFCTNKDFYKKCYRLLAKSIHPDNSDGNIEAMQCLNQLKVMWGI